MAVEEGGGFCHCEELAWGGWASFVSEAFAAPEAGIVVW